MEKGGSIIGSEPGPTKEREDAFHRASHVSMPCRNRIINITKVIVEQGLVQQRSSLINTLKGYLVIKGFVYEHNKTLNKDAYPEQRCIATMEGRGHMLTPHRGAKGS